MILSHGTELSDSSLPELYCVSAFTSNPIVATVAADQQNVQSGFKGRVGKLFLKHF